MTVEFRTLTHEVRTNIQQSDKSYLWLVGAALVAALLFYYWQNPLSDTIVYDDDSTRELPDNRLNYPEHSFVSDWDGSHNPPCPGGANGEHNWSMQKDYIWICSNAGCPLAWDPKHSTM